MSKVISFFATLKRSTKITLISCVSFVLMTFLILCFFIMSPITPSDKAGHTYGRESLSPDDATNTTSVTTLAGESVEVSKGTSTVTVTTTRKEYKITITTGTSKYSDYYSEGRINAGGYEGGYTNPYQTTTSAYTTQPYTGYTEPYTGSGEEPYTGEDPTEPVTGDQPTEPVTEAPTEYIPPTTEYIPPATEYIPPTTDAPKPSESSMW